MPNIGLGFRLVNLAQSRVGSLPVQASQSFFIQASQGFFIIQHTTEQGFLSSPVITYMFSVSSSPTQDRFSLSSTLGKIGFPNYIGPHTTASFLAQHSRGFSAREWISVFTSPAHERFHLFRSITGPAVDIGHIISTLSRQAQDRVSVLFRPTRDKVSSLSSSDKGQSFRLLQSAHNRVSIFSSPARSRVSIFTSPARNRVPPSSAKHRTGFLASSTAQNLIFLFANQAQRRIYVFPSPAQ